MRGLNIFIIFIILFIIPIAISQEDCYTDFYLTQSYDANGDFHLGYAGVGNFYGDYFSQVSSTSSLFGLLKVYNSTNTLIGQYGLNKYTNEIVGTLIPYNSNISRISVVVDGVETNLSGFSPSAMQCERTCKSLGESGVYGVDYCCEDLSRAGNGLNFVCTDCGNGVCGANENYRNCSFDCGNGVPVDANCSTGYIMSSYGCVKSGVCGNGVLESEEDCDDGGISGGDGCSSSCHTEPCVDSDNSTISGTDASVFSFGYAYANGDYSFDKCDTNTSLKEYYCLSSTSFSVPSKSVNCSYGCLNGRCLTETKETKQTLAAPSEPSFVDSIFSTLGNIVASVFGLFS